MGIQVEEPHGRSQPPVDQLDTALLPNCNDTSHGFRSYELNGIAAEPPAAATSNRTTPTTGMKDELVLLAWLIVLLRTREDGIVSYSWTYNPTTTVALEKTAEDVPLETRLSSAEVLPGLRSNVGDAAAAVLQHINNAVAPRPHSTDTVDPSSLLLSTGSLTRTPSKAASEEVSTDTRECWCYLVDCQVN